MLSKDVSVSNNSVWQMTRSDRQKAWSQSREKDIATGKNICGASKVRVWICSCVMFFSVWNRTQVSHIPHTQWPRVTLLKQLPALQTFTNWHRRNDNICLITWKKWKKSPSQSCTQTEHRYCRTTSKNWFLCFSRFLSFFVSWYKYSLSRISPQNVFCSNHLNGSLLGPARKCSFCIWQGTGSVKSCVVAFPNSLACEICCQSMRNEPSKKTIDDVQRLTCVSFPLDNEEEAFFQTK